LNYEKDKAICNILKIGEVKIMLDCGCNYAESESQLDILYREAETCNIILLSHST
jgi:Cft2 family RNA processing exonuclease